MVPGAERKLQEHQRLSSEYLDKHISAQQRQQYDVLRSDIPKYEPECGPLLNKTPPDVCTTNKCIEFATSDIESALIPGVIEHNFAGANSLAGQTVPITIKNHHPPHHQHHQSPLAYSNFTCNKYGTMPHPGTTVHQGFLGVSELGSSSSNSSSSYCSKSKTLQHQRPRAKKCVKIETFQVPETGFADFSKRSNTLSYSGSAVWQENCLARKYSKVPNNVKSNDHELSQLV